jgi:hypothetical protein
MPSLDHYDPLQLSSWHHFAYRADAGRIADLRGALVGYLERGDQQPLEEFFLRYRAGDHERLCAPHLAPSAEEIERVLVGWQSAPDALGEYRDEIARAVKAVRHSLAGGSVARCLWDPISRPDERLAYLADLVRYEAPVELLADQRGLCVAELDSLARGLLPPLPELPDDLHSLFEESVELCLVDPYQENVGLWRLYGVGLDPPLPLGRGLVDDPFPEGRERCAYGLEGSALSVVGRDEAAGSAGELRAFEPPPDRMRAHAAARVRRELDEAGEWDDEAWEELVEEQEDAADDEIDEDALAVDFLRTRSSDRLAAAIGELAAEWAEIRDRLAGALEETARGECVLLQWESKDPSV